MMKSLIVLMLLISNAFAYVPTVESLFRHGSNPDVTANGVNLTFVVKKIDLSTKEVSKGESLLLNESKSEDFYKLFFTRVNKDVFKVAQTRYSNSSFSESSLLEKIYFPNFTSYTNKNSAEESEKGIFQGMLISMIFNDGAFLVNYLKSLSVPVKLNNEIINRQKVTNLASYKQYLTAINKDRTSKKTEINPLKPEDPAARDRIDAVMNEPMYVDQHQVKLSRENGEMAWLISAGSFEAVVSYKDREIQRIKYKSQLGDYEISCKEPWLANGTHALPRYIVIKDYKGEIFRVEILNLRHYIEKESELINRLKKWDGLLRGKESIEPKPSFVL
jgi:hypothetical protein